MVVRPIEVYGEDPLLCAWMLNSPVLPVVEPLSLPNQDIVPTDSCIAGAMVVLLAKVEPWLRTGPPALPTIGAAEVSAMPVRAMSRVPYIEPGTAQ